MRTVGLDRPMVFRWEPGRWVSWIPPKSSDIDECGDHIGPAGETFFDTFQEAAEFLCEMLAERAKEQRGGQQ